MRFEKKFIIADKILKNKAELFEEIADIAFKSKITLNKQALVEGFIRREAEGTTGFEDQFAIPHARIDEVLESSIFVIRNEQKFEDWESLDGNGVRYAIVLLIPASQGSVHMEILSNIAMKMMDEEFRQVIKTGTPAEIFNLFTEFINGIEKNKKEEKEQQEGRFKKTLIGISACPAGVAHTFMAKQKMEDSGNELGYNVKWETQGSQGQKNPLTQEEIDKADLIIIASDIDIDLKRFEGKKVLITDTNDAIKNGPNLIIRAEKESKLFKKDEHKNTSSIINLLKKSFMSSFGIPWTFLGITVTLLSIISLIGFSMYGRQWSDATVNYSLNPNLFKVQEIVKFVLSLAMPFMAMHIVHNMYQKNSLSFVVFIAALLVNMPLINVTLNTITSAGILNSQAPQISLFYDWGVFNLSSLHGTNIIGALVSTFGIIGIFKITQIISSYFKENRFLKYVNSSLVTNIMFAGISLVVFVFLLGAPLAWISTNSIIYLIDYSNTHWWVRLLIGGILGVLVVIDMGGPINKVALIVLIGLAQYDLRFATLITIAIPCASIGYGTVYFFRKKSFKEIDILDASKSFRSGLKGMTEGPLSASIKYKWRIHLPNVISTFVAAGLANVLGFYVISGGHINILFAGASTYHATANDIGFLNDLFPLSGNSGSWWLFVPSILYGIISYYFVMAVGCITYLGVSSISFALPGKNKVFK